MVEWIELTLKQTETLALCIYATFLFFMIAFLFWFIFPTIRTWRQLKRALSQLNAITGTSRSGEINPATLFTSEQHSQTIQHLWREYRETLHGQKSVSIAGAVTIERWRATVLARTFFSQSTLVDSPLHTEFFKHLPGIFTGLGILGTFLGLLSGLGNFKVSEDPSIVRQSLEFLMSAVSHAFTLSMLAIACAMLITLVEKFSLTKLYKKAEDLCHAIDGLYEAGAGEEYLAKLVDASENSATQLCQLKDSLIGDLKQILSELAQQQITAVDNVLQKHTAATSATTQALVDQLSRSIEQTMKSPLERIASTVGTTAQNQSESVGRLLTDVLTAFSAKLESLFGDQIHGMTSLIQQTSGTLQSTASQFERLAVDIGLAGRGATQAMAEHMQKSAELLDARQQAANDNSASFLNSVRASMTASQDETRINLQALLGDLGTSVSSTLDTIRAHAKETAESQRAQQEVVANQTVSIVSTLSDQLNNVLRSVSDSTSRMAEDTTSLKRFTVESIEQMNVAAQRVSSVLHGFLDASTTVANVMQQISGVSGHIAAATSALTSATSDVKGVINDYQSSRAAIGSIVEEFYKILHDARREAGLTQELAMTLQGAATALGNAQKQADGYLTQVTDVITQVHDEFAKGIKKTLRESNGQFHEELAQATGYLRTAVQELGDVVEAIPS